jgi:hypothetical protein
MYYLDGDWKTIKDIEMSPVALSAFIALPSGDSDYVKLFILGGLELDKETKRFNQKSS